MHHGHRFTSGSCEGVRAQSTTIPVAGHNSAGLIAKQDGRPFVLEALVDFVDDAILSPVPITRQHIDRMMQRLQELGVRRVSWAYYGDGHGGMLFPAGYQIKDHPDGWKTAQLVSRTGKPVEGGRRSRPSSRPGSLRVLQAV